MVQYRLNWIEWIMRSASSKSELISIIRQAINFIKSYR
jgi:hypothetical protein